MFIKINELYNFLIKSGYKSYAGAIEKIALEESDFENRYPNIYSAWNKKRDKPISAYLAQISRAEAKGIDLNQESISSFEDIIEVLKGEKQREKSSKSEEILEALKKEDVGGITEENIELAFGAGLNREEIIYLARDKCNHTWKEKIHYADRFKKERLALFDKDTELTDFKDIDEVRDEYFSKKNKSPLVLEDFYKKIKPIAIENSEVIYNSKKYIVVHSMSKEAAQYWEQSCVTVSDKGVVNSGLCSAHPYESMFDNYDSYLHSFQIITKEYETLKETPRTSFQNNNEEYNLITLSIYKDSGEVSWGGQDTVNRLNEEVGAVELLFVLGDEYEEVCNKMSEYCKVHLNLDIKNLKTSAENATELSPGAFFHFSEKIPKDIFDEVAEEKARDIYFDDFFDFAEKIPKDIFNKIAEEKARDINSQYFYYFAEKMPKDIFYKLAEEKAVELDPDSFFEYAEKIPKDIFNKLAEENAIELDSYLFFDFAEKIPKDIFDEFVEERAGELVSTYFFEYAEKIPKDIFDKLVEKKARELFPRSFFSLSEKIPKDIFNKLVEKKAVLLTQLDLPIFKHLIPEKIYQKLKK